MIRRQVSGIQVQFFLWSRESRAYRLSANDCRRHTSLEGVFLGNGLSADCHRGGGRHRLDFYEVISVENLFSAWREFAKGKRRKPDVARFEVSLEDNIIKLNEELASDAWRPDPYVAFSICDPKPRRIHKASVRNRVLYQAVFRKMYDAFDSGFIHDSYSSRLGKGTHAGVTRSERFIGKASSNWHRPTFVLQCDVRKFFDSIDHEILLSLIARRIGDERILQLARKIIGSFSVGLGKGLPLGNVTSQLFANIYLNEFDQFMKRTLDEPLYLRYCDDFAVVGTNRQKLASLLPLIEDFLKTRLKLSLHERKTSIRSVMAGIDFLGYVILPHRNVLRTKTKRRIFQRLERGASKETIQSYVGVLSHGKNRNLEQKLHNLLAEKFSC